MLAATPERLWEDLEALVRPKSASDSALFVRLNRPRPRGDQQPRIPIRLRIDDRGTIRADTSVGVPGRALRVAIERIDTLWVRRPF